MSIPTSTAPAPSLLRICLTPGANLPTTNFVRLIQIRAGQDVPANNRSFSPLHDFLLVEFWTRKIFNSSDAPSTYPEFEQQASDLLNSFNPDSSVPPFNHLQIRIRLDKLIKNHAFVLRNAFSASPAQLSFHQVSNFHTLFPFFGFGKLVHVTHLKRLGVKTWETNRDHLVLLFPRFPAALESEVRVTLPTSSPCQTTNRCHQFKILDDIILLQHWHSGTFSHTAMSPCAIADSTLQSLRTLHLLTRRNPIPNFTAGDVHVRLHYLFQNYVNVLRHADGMTSHGALPLRHNTFSQFAAVYRFLGGRHIHFHDPSCDPPFQGVPCPEVGAPVRATESVERWKHDGGIGHGEDVDTRAESSEESKWSGGKREVRAGNDSAGEACEMSGNKDWGHKVRVRSIKFSQSKEREERDREAEDGGEEDRQRAFKVWGGKVGGKVLIEAEGGHDDGDGLEDERDSGDVGLQCAEDELPAAEVGMTGGGGGAGKRTRELEDGVKYEELMVRRLELAMKVRELAVRREQLELECAELKLKRRKVEREMRDWKLGKLNECVEVMKAGEGNERLERVAEDLTRDFEKWLQ